MTKLVSFGAASEKTLGSVIATAHTDPLGEKVLDGGFTYKSKMSGTPAQKVPANRDPD